MDDAHQVLEHLLKDARATLVENLRSVSLDEALQSAGGYRSILGMVKHVAAWSAVYYSYAFDPRPRHWDDTDWPRGLRDRIEPTGDYFAEVLGWFERSYQRWLSAVRETTDVGGLRPVHWGAAEPLTNIIVMTASHWTYHAGEMNAVLAIVRHQAWEYGEEVEENHISTVGHRMRPGWMTDEQAAAYDSTAPSPRSRRAPGGGE